MKNLHRKISAMLLAGMVVVGGVAVSGVQSFASANKIYSPGEERQIQRVKFYCRDYGEVYENKDEKEINKRIEDYSLLYGSRRGFSVRNPYEIPGHLQKAKYSGKEFVKVKCNNIYYLIKIK